jgi:hypothetical protein
MLEEVVGMGCIDPDLAAWVESGSTVADPLRHSPLREA